MMIELGEYNLIQLCDVVLFTSRSNGGIVCTSNQRSEERYTT